MRRLSALGAAALGAIWLTCPSSAGAGTGGSYTATSDARLVAVDVVVSPPILFDPLFDGGSSVAQAEIDSLGATSAFASNVYPGATILGLPGLLAGYGFPSESVPTYPLIARSDQLTPADHREAGTVVLDAQSQMGSSSGRVTDGAANASAMVLAEPDGGRVTATAEASVPSLQLGAGFQASGVRSSAEVSRSASGELERTSTFEVSSLMVLGQRLAVTGTGISILGSDLPLGVDLDTALADVLGALTDQGTTLEFLPAVESDDGITSAGLRITTVLNPPPEVASGVETITSVVTFGRVSATVSNSAFGSSGLVSPPVSVPTPNSPSTSQGGSAGGTGVAASPRATTAPPARATTAAPTAAAVDGTSIALDISLSRFYPVLVLAGLVGVATVSAIRQLGVRHP
jgi:hypothetical protein